MSLVGWSVSKRPWSKLLRARANGTLKNISMRSVLFLAFHLLALNEG